jgi:hypothetical protein
MRGLAYVGSCTQSIDIKEVTVMSECILTAAIIAIIYFACGYLRKLQGPTNQ